ncbi:hypothetical protein [uncultured Algoriphagus sp.]|uniref:hypothetical protein n=1 Tax=uncultured Algoriphagus sp. TaxID=417365 RepID=UPI0030ED36F8|tara:strand:+ start:1208 stop:1678 length:471 start_codon:yes stop_codon:yes gene_type:complete
MESNHSYHLLFKYVLLGAGLVLISLPLLSLLFPNLVEINGKTGAMSPISSSLFGIIGVILIVLFLSIKDKFAVVEIGNQTITIKQNGKVNTFQWMEIESVSQFQFVFPPLYKLTIKDNEKTVWFNTEPNYTSIGGYSTDNSEMGNLIKKKKRELSL